ncbi:flagellar protein FliT [Brevibacillus panacihumi]|uniref:flagellar protein FliT n=1 Tax=Brevibacillus panacihumi TaxID=497735 RepID=UPI003D00D37B
MMQQNIDQLLGHLFDKTTSLLQLIEQAESEPEEWASLLDEREKVIENVQSILATGYMFSPAQKQQLEQMQQMNLQIMPMMEQRKMHVQKKLEEIRQKKAATQFYNSGGATAYGAFFDRKN